MGIYDDEESSTESNEEQQPLTLDATAGTTTVDSANNLSLAGSSEDAEGFTIVSGLTTEEPLQAEVVNDTTSTVSVSATSKSIGLAETENQESFHVGQDEEEKACKNCWSWYRGCCCYIAFWHFARSSCWYRCCVWNKAGWGCRRCMPCSWGCSMRRWKQSKGSQQ